MDLGLAGRVVLVTGGSDGLGAALARRLAQEGARVAVCARDEARLRATAERIVADGGDALAVPADVTRPEDLERFVGEAVARWGQVDALVNNAGQAAGRPFDATDDEAWQADLELKLLAAVRASRLVLPHLRAAGGGAILNTLAIAARAPGASSMPSSVSRAAGLALTKGMSRDLGRDNVRVNAVLIGFVQSGQWERRARAQGRDVEQVYADLAREQSVPLGRVGKAEEFADLAAFLVSPRAAYVTGAAINFDGGASPVA